MGERRGWWAKGGAMMFFARRRRPVSPGQWWSRALYRLTADERELEADDLQRAAQVVGAVPMSSCRDRDDACVAGTVRSVTSHSRSGAPSLAADIYDGSGTVTLVFLGRKHIPGIEAGRSLKASGRITLHDNKATIFNPRYELLPASPASA